MYLLLKSTPLAISAALASSIVGPRLIDQATFSAGVNSVAIYATVIGPDEALERRLTVKDFEIRDNGKLKDITLFQAGQLPITVALLLDDSPSMRPSKPTTVAAASAFVRRLTPPDRATIGVFSRTVRIEGDLTSDRAELLDRLRLVVPPMAGTSLWDAANAGLAVLEGEGGRRVLLMLTDGDDNSSEISPTEIVGRVAREGVMIYGIGLRGGDGRLNTVFRDLARNSGGWFFELKNADKLDLTFQRVADELHSQYLLGFSPEVLDGSVHRLEVKVKRGGMTVRARKSYLALPSQGMR
jgi:Ca-activated chloride channel homolog